MTRTEDPLGYGPGPRWRLTLAGREQARPIARVRPQRGDYRHVRVALIAAIKIEPRRTLTGTVSG